MEPQARSTIVLAPDKFKGSLSAHEVVAAMRAAIPPQFAAVSLPIADGGDGSVQAALDAGWTGITVATQDSWGAPIATQIATSGHRALLEVASICGLHGLTPTPQEAVTATSFGVGQVIKHLVTQGVTEVVVALGGSATTDGGSGMLRALGVRLTDAKGGELPAHSLALERLAAVDTSGLVRGLAGVSLVFAADVDTLMTGARGTAAVFAPQKGADAAAVAQLGAALEHAAPILEDHFGHPGASSLPGAGAAGGLAWAGLLLGGRVRSGSELFLTLLNARERIAGAALVITGEGRIDGQSLFGKAPYAVACLAHELGVPAAAIVGSNALDHAVPEFAEIIALDRLDPRCKDDPELSRRLITTAVAQLLRDQRGLAVAAGQGE